MMSKSELYRGELTHTLLMPDYVRIRTYFNRSSLKYQRIVSFYFRFRSRTHPNFYLHNNTLQYTSFLSYLFPM